QPSTRLIQEGEPAAQGLSQQGISAPGRIAGSPGRRAAGSQLALLSLSVVMPALSTLLARKGRITGEQALATHERRQTALWASKNGHGYQALAQNINAKD